MEPAANVVFIGSLPGTRTGRSIFTKAVVDGMQKKYGIRIFNIVESSNAFYRKIWKTLLSAFSFVPLIYWIRPGRRALYLALNGGQGLWSDLWILTCARLLKYRCFIHHHSYEYITQKKFTMAAIDWIIGTSGVHIVHSSRMIADFTECYNSKRQFLTLAPSLVTLPTMDTPNRTTTPFTIGQLSNLTVEKGLDLVLQVFEEMVADGRDVSIVLAGPCVTQREQQLIDDALRRYPDRVDYRGAVYGQDKVQFFHDINVFLFPTKYKTESWGIVLNEALTASVPVIAFGRACVPDVIGESVAGVIVPPDGDFPAAAKRKIEEWIVDDGAYQTAVTAALSRGRQLEQEAANSLDHLVEAIYHPGDSFQSDYAMQ